MLMRFKFKVLKIELALDNKQHVLCVNLTSIAFSFRSRFLT